MKNVVGIRTYWTWKRQLFLHQRHQRTVCWCIKRCRANIFSWDRILLEGNTKERMERDS